MLRKAGDEAGGWGRSEGSSGAGCPGPWTQEYREGVRLEGGGMGGVQSELATMVHQVGAVIQHLTRLVGGESAERDAAGGGGRGPDGTIGAAPAGPGQPHGAEQLQQVMERKRVELQQLHLELVQRCARVCVCVVCVCVCVQVGGFAWRLCVRGAGGGGTWTSTWAGPLLPLPLAHQG